MRLILIILLLAANCFAEDYIIATGENGTEEVYVADKMVYTNWLNDVVLWMPFPAEKLAGTFYDYSIEENDGSQATAGFRPTWTNAFSGVYEFAADDYISIGNPVSLRLQDAITCSSWFKTTSVTVGKLINSFMSVGNGGFECTINTAGNAIFAIRVNSGTQIIAVSPTGGYNDGVWHSFVGTYDRVNVKLYIDGILLDTTAETRQMDVGTPAVEVGRRGDGIHYFDGFIDDAIICNSAQSSNQLFNAYMQEPTLANGGKR